MVDLRSKFPLLVLLASAALGQDVFLTPSEYSFPPGSTFPGATWEKVSSPEAVGYSSERLEILRAWLKTQNTTGMMAVTGGRVLFEYGNVSETSKLASVRKSILGMLFGKYIATESRVLHASVKELGLDDMTPFTGPEQYATLQDLLMSRSGICHVFVHARHGANRSSDGEGGEVERGSADAEKLE
ncbi:MAG: hypothetical protein SGI92_18815 [Bryobacteraceae bacterium]|nr:hypothetical protein [Bryobacteraceae bacterium]